MSEHRGFKLHLEGKEYMAYKAMAGGKMRRLPTGANTEKGAMEWLDRVLGKRTVVRVEAPTAKVKCTCTGKGVYGDTFLMVGMVIPIRLGKSADPRQCPKCEQPTNLRPLVDPLPF